MSPRIILTRAAAAVLVVATTLIGSAFVDSAVGTGRFSGATGDFLNSLGVKLQVRVATNAELAAYKWGGRVTRDGFAAAGDGGGAIYTHSASACPIPGGDGGSQVPAPAGGCFRIDWASVGREASPFLFEAAATSNNDTVAIQKALDTGQTASLCGKSKWAVSSDLVRKTNGQIIRGCGKDRTYVGAVAPGGFAVGVMVNQAGVATIDRDYAVYAVQPDTNNAAALNTYPPLFYLRNCPHFRMEGMGAYLGTVAIDMKGNSGGAVIRDLQVSAFRTGIDIDGSADTVRIIDPHWFPVSMSANQQQIFFGQGAARPIGINSGRMDDLKIVGGLFIGGLAMNFYNGDGSVSGAAGAGPTFGEMSGVDFDTYSGIVAGGQASLSCALCIFTVGADPAVQAAVLKDAASLHLTGSAVAVGASPANPVLVVGGNGALGTPRLTWSGGTFAWQAYFDQTAIKVGSGSGSTRYGEAIVTGVIFTEPSQTGTTRNAPMIGVGSFGRLTATGNRAGDDGTGTGTFIAIEADGFHRVAFNAAPGWSNTLAGSAMPNSLTPTSAGGVYAGN